MLQIEHINNHNSLTKGPYF